jgi:hypothetical protein
MFLFILKITVFFLVSIGSVGDSEADEVCTIVRWVMVQEYKREEFSVTSYSILGQLRVLTRARAPSRTY